METCINEGDSKLHGELNRMLKDNEKLKQEKEITDSTVLKTQEQLSQALKEFNALKDQVNGDLL